MREKERERKNKGEKQTGRDKVKKRERRQCLVMWTSFIKRFPAT
jgi:hypothetical protein